MIDLRSDVKTKPTDLMRQAMATAEVGDDIAGEDPTVNELERRSAELLGKPAGLFVPSGTMGNLVGLLALTWPGQKMILHQEAHVFRWERAGLTRIAGLMTHPLPGAYGAFSPEDLEGAIWEPDLHSPTTGVVALENTHNRAGGTCLSVAQTRELCEVAHRRGVPVHVDGARIFNAAVALGVEARELAAPADSVTFCFSKGLGAPVGSMVCGETDFIDRAREYRKLLGGAMRQAGVVAAAGLVALEHELPRLGEDHEKARRLAETLSGLPGIVLDLRTVQTNLVRFEVRREDLTAPELCRRLGEQGIKAGAQSDTEIRFVTHRDQSFADLKVVCGALREILKGE